MKASPLVTAPQIFDHRLRLDDFGRICILHAFAAAPLLDLIPPGGHRRRTWLGICRIELRQQFLQDVLDIADNRYVDLDPLGDRRRIDVDMDDLARVGRKMFWIADHPVVEAGADRDEHIGVLHRHIGFVSAMHAGPTDILVAGSPCKRLIPSRYWYRENRAGRRADSVLRMRLRE